MTGFLTCGQRLMAQSWEKNPVVHLFHTFVNILVNTDVTGPRIHTTARREDHVATVDHTEGVVGTVS